MLRSCFTLGIVLAVGVGCDDGPTALDVTPAPSPATIRFTNAVATMRVLLDDPLVGTLIAEADHTRATKRISQAMAQVREEMAVGDPQTLGRTLHAAERELMQSTDDGTMIARTALNLTLHAVRKLLDDATTADSGTNALANPKRSP